MIINLHAPDPERSGKEESWGRVCISRRNGDRSGKDLTGARAGGRVREEAAGIGGALGGDIETEPSKVHQLDGDLPGWSLEYVTGLRVLLNPLMPVVPALSFHSNKSQMPFCPKAIWIVSGETWGAG